jgi:adenylate cyclase
VEEEKRLSRLARRARDLDSGPGAVRAARAARELLPGDSSFGDPLSTGGKAPTDLLGRYLLEVSEKPSATREIGLGAVQVLQSLAESRGRGKGTEEVAILFTDLVDFSSWALQAGDESALELLRMVGEAVEGSVRERDGKVVKRLGDGLMAAFPAPEDAVAAVCHAQKELSEVEVEGYAPALRGGVHVGRPRKMGGDYLGVDVNIAARLAEGAGGGEVLISEAVCRQLSEDDFEVRRKRRFRAKGAPKDLQVYSVRPLG